MTFLQSPFDNAGMKKWMPICWPLFVLLCVFAPQGAGAAEALLAEPERHALVLANADYKMDPLRNPLADGALMAETLRRAGFAVTQQNNLSRAGFFETVARYTREVKPGSISVVYYAGHGMQIQGSNYLIPVDMVPTSEAGVAARAYSLTALIEKMQASKAAVNIAILDACRNNPFKPNLAAARRAYAGLGLGKVLTPRGMVIAYSTAPGQLAEDGAAAGNSLYTVALTKQIDQRGLTIEQILKNVGDSVRRRTLDDQQPWFETSLISDFYFYPPAGVRLSVAPRQPASGAAKTGSAARSFDTTTAWYSQLNASEWTQLDQDIARRVLYLTDDEIPELEKRAREGGLVAQTTLGLVYREGITRAQAVDRSRDGYGRERDSTVIRSKSSNTQSLRWLKQAADAGFPPAQVELGEMYFEGKYVDRNLEESLRWLDLAAVADYPRARIDKAQLALQANPTDSEAVRAFLNTLMPGTKPR